MAAVTASPMLDMVRGAATTGSASAAAVVKAAGPGTTKTGAKRPRDSDLDAEMFSPPFAPALCGEPSRSADRKILAAAVSTPASALFSPSSALCAPPSALSAPPSEMCTPPTPSSATRNPKRRMPSWDEQGDAHTLPLAVPPTPNSVLQSARCLSASPSIPHLAPAPPALLLEEIDSDSTCSSPVDPPRVPLTPRLSAQRMKIPAETPTGDSRKRQRAQPSQVQRLDAAFQAAVSAREGSAHGGKSQAEGQVLVSAERQWQLAAELGLLPRQVSAWFQTRQLEWQAEQGEAELRKMRTAHAGLAEHCREMRSDYELLKGDYGQMLLHIAKILNKITEVEKLLNADDQRGKSASPDVNQLQAFQQHQSEKDQNRHQQEQGGQKREQMRETGGDKVEHAHPIAQETAPADKVHWGIEKEQPVSASASASTIGSDGAAPLADLSSPHGGDGDLSGTFLDDFEELSGSLGGQQDFFEAATAAAEAPLREMGLLEAHQAHQGMQQPLGEAEQAGKQHLVGKEQGLGGEGAGQEEGLAAGGKESEPFEVCGVGMDTELMGLFWGSGGDGDDIVIG